MDDEDPVLRELARATAAENWIEWRAEDLWPRRTHLSRPARLTTAAPAAAR